MSDGKLRSNRYRPTIDNLKKHFSEVLAMVTNDEADQRGDDDNNVTPVAVGESAEAEGEHHDGAFDFGPPGGPGPVRPPPVAEEVPADIGSVPHRHGDAETHEEEVDADVFTSLLKAPVWKCLIFAFTHDSQKGFRYLQMSDGVGVPLEDSHFPLY